MPIVDRWASALPRHRSTPAPVFLHPLPAIVLSGVLIALSAPGVGDWSWLAWVAFAPWLASRSRLPLLWGLLMGLVYIIPGHWSTFASAVGSTGLQGYWRDAWTLLFFATYAVPFALFACLDRHLCAWAGAGALQSLALLRAGVLSSLICLCWSPFPYTPATAIVDSIGIAQWASVGGEPLLLTLLLWPSALLAGLWQTRPPLAQARNALLGLALILILATVIGHARVALADRAQAQGAGLQLSALALQLDLPARAAPSLLTRDRPASAASAVELTRRGYEAAPDCELAVWPETTVDIAHGPRVCAAGQALAAATGKPLLMQCYRALDQQHQLTAEWLRPQALGPAVHAKSSLVPAYERPLWGEGRLRAGTPGRVFDVDHSRRLIPALCYELYAGSHVRRSVLAGGQFIAHMVSFTGFDRQPIDLWDQPMARLQAIAYGVPILRVGNRAPIGWIDAHGRTRAQSERFGQRASCMQLWSPASAPTLYTQIAPLAAWLPALALLAFTQLRQRARHRPWAGSNLEPNRRSPT